MVEQTGSDSRKGDSQGTAQFRDSEEQSGDPGRTPGKAEGDEETVEESLKGKES